MQISVRQGDRAIFSFAKRIISASQIQFSAGDYIFKLIKKVSVSETSIRIVLTLEKQTKSTHGKFILRTELYLFGQNSQHRGKPQKSLSGMQDILESDQQFRRMFNKGTVHAFIYYA